MKEGTKGTLTFGDGKTARVELERILTYPSTGMPSDYLFKYEEGETHRPLVHEKFNGSFPLPEMIVSMYFKED
jgi:hypothetical protein